ncbi:MAG: FtsQ-type POTRA domain-containing protein [Candidatus Andersenbacteria bacterium]
MARPPVVDDMRPIRRRAPVARPHGKTLYHVRERRLRVSPRAVRGVLVGIVAILLIGVYILIFWTPTFRVEQPVVTGTQRVDASVIQAAVAPQLNGLRWLVFPRRALLSAPTTDIEHAAEQASGSIEHVAVRKELPNTLRLEVTERQPKAIWSAAGNFFFVDDRGIAYDQIQRSESRDVSLPVIVDEAGTPTEAGDRVTTTDALTFVADVYAELTRGGGIGINFFVAPSRLAPDLILVTSEGWKVYFDTTTDAHQQVLTLQTVLKQQVKDRRNLKYIDLRVPGRVFIK